MAITSVRVLNTMSSPSDWARSWAKANAQVKKVKTQSDFLNDVQERLYLPQIQESPNVHLYSKTYRLAAARRRHGTKRKRLQRENVKDSLPKLPDIRQTWSMFEEVNENTENERPRSRSNSDSHLPPINDTKQQIHQKRKPYRYHDHNNNYSNYNKETNSLSVSLVVDYTNQDSLNHRAEQTTNPPFPPIPSYPVRRSWKKNSLYRRTLEPIERREHDKKKREKQIVPKIINKESLARLPQIKKHNSVVSDAKQVETVDNYRLKLTEQNIDEYRKQQERKASAGRRMLAPPNSAKSAKKMRRKSKLQSDSLRRKSKEDRTTTKINDDSGFSCKTVTDIKRKNSYLEQCADNEQVYSGEATNQNIYEHALYTLSEDKRQEIENWLDECERAKPNWLPVPGDPNEEESQRLDSGSPEVDGEVEEVKMPFDDTAKIRNLVFQVEEE
ncbi:uncharacterized protein LOC144345064 [Saccoglossus kowalevskii]